MPSLGILHHITLVRTDVSEECSACKVTGIELGTTLAVTSNRSSVRLLVTANVVPSWQILLILMVGALHSSETSILTRATQRNITGDGILQIRNRFPCVRFEVFTAVTMKNGVLWDVTPRGTCKNRRFGGT
jgi:hypothetical protein